MAAEGQRSSIGKQYRKSIVARGRQTDRLPILAPLLLSCVTYEKLPFTRSISDHQMGGFSTQETLQFSMDTNWVPYNLIGF